MSALLAHNREVAHNTLWRYDRLTADAIGVPSVVMSLAVAVAPSAAAMPLAWLSSRFAETSSMERGLRIGRQTVWRGLPERANGQVGSLFP
ncbi:MAG TPA: hypothetical protein VKT77_11750 [Chthonomonadaceae bacterium]|nr:hypothetical protein [Chthonomonadaceae bacterium]